MTSRAQSPAPPRRPLVAWWFSDGKAGHANQVRGLLAALSERLPLEAHALPALNTPQALAALLWQRAVRRDLPVPDLLLGAGHRTHLSLLAARRAHGGRAVVLMKPSLPRRCFDLCIVPEHDGVRSSARVLVTRGVLNAVRPSPVKRPGSGLILVGGPSSHHGWDEAVLLERIKTIAEHDPARHWTVAGSRRTPPATERRLAALGLLNVDNMSYRDSRPEWLPAQLATAEQVWVTEDSVSMIYEALTAGAAVGVLDVPRRGAGRVVRGVESLLREQWVTSFAAWRQGRALRAPQQVFDEAARCAQWMVERWFSVH